MLDKLFDMTVRVSLERPRQVLWITAAMTALLMLAFPFVKIDVDPENMLSETEPVRIYHNAMKKKMDIYDMALVGITLDEHSDGVFNPDSLGRIHKLSKFIMNLEDIVPHQLVTPGSIDAIEPAGPATIRFSRLMKQPPTDREGCMEVRKRARSNPYMTGTLLSTDEKSIGLYIPLKSKDRSFRVAELVREKIRELAGPEKYHITGLPVAEDTFGVEMFIDRKSVV